MAAQASLGGAQFSFGGHKQLFGGHGPGMSPRGAGPATLSSTPDGGSIENGTKLDKSGVAAADQNGVTHHTSDDQNGPKYTKGYDSPAFTDDTTL